jgi:hypothetical protein
MSRPVSMLGGVYNIEVGLEADRPVRFTGVSVGGIELYEASRTTDGNS